MMAFYTSDFDDFGEYNYYSTPNYYTSYDLVPFQYSSSSYNDSTSCYDIVPFQDPSLSLNETNDYAIVPFEDSSFYSRHEYTEPNTFEYHPNDYDIVSYDPSEANYYAHNFTEPKLLEYNPNFHNTHYFPSDTRFITSYSNARVTEDTEFDDYDPTPYDGGYDIAQTYGKPLEASDQLCYPRSASLPDGLLPINPSYDLIPSPYANTEKVIDKTPTSEPNLVKEQPSNGNGDSNVNEPENPLELSDREKSDNVENNGVYGKYGYGSYDKPIIQFQGTYNNGYGLEAMDLCEGLFGYWPCLDKKLKRECGNCGQVTTEDDQWKSAADYLFGSYGYNNFD